MTEITTSKTTSNTISDEPRENVGFSAGEAALALEELMPALQALPKSQVTHPRVPVNVAVARGYRILRYAREDSARFVDTFVHFDPALIDRFELAIQALWLADDHYRTALDDARDGFDELVARCRDTRAQLLTFCDGAFFGHPALAEKLSEIRQGSGHRDLADDLRKVVALIRANIDLFRSFVNISEPQLERVSRLGDQLIRQIEATKASSRSELQEIRNRAFTFFAAIYADVVRHGTFLDSESDADKRYINLYSDLARRSAVSPSAAGRGNTTVGDGVDGAEASDNGETSSDELSAVDNTPSGPVSAPSSDASDASTTH